MHHTTTPSKNQFDTLLHLSIYGRKNLNSRMNFQFHMLNFTFMISKVQIFKPKSTNNFKMINYTKSQQKFHAQTPKRS